MPCFKLSGGSLSSYETLRPLMNNLLHHAIITGTCDRVLKYMGRPVYKDGQPHPLSNPELLTKVGAWHDGTRVRHYVDNNSVKFYNQQNVLRIEMTMNNPRKFHVQRKTEGDDTSKGKKISRCEKESRISISEPKYPLKGTDALQSNWQLFLMIHRLEN